MDWNAGCVKHGDNQKIIPAPAHFERQKINALRPFHLNIEINYPTYDR